MFKYSVRISFLNPYIIASVYSLFFIVCVFYLKRFADQINNCKYFKTIFLSIAVIMLMVMIFINIFTDGPSLNTDRWSALEIFIESILQHKYPYDVLDHLSNTTSNLPALFFIGIPFYILGDVGYLQVFVFLALILVVMYAKMDNSKKTFVIFLLLFSPAYYWELFAKSDLLSNCFLALLFIFKWQQKYFNRLFSNHVLLAFFVAFFILTRGIILIPLSLFLFSEFYFLKLKSKIYFFLFFLFFLFLISLPVLTTLPDLSYTILHNPFNHQVGYAPKILIIISIIAPFFLSFRVNQTRDVFLFSAYIFSFLMFLAFGVNCIEEGFSANVFGNLFDISYFSIIIPCVFFYFLKVNTNQPKKTNSLLKRKIFTMHA